MPLGLWLGIVGYGILYAGVTKLGGGTCTLRQAFTGQCQPGSSQGANSQGTTGSAQSGQSALATNPMPAPGDSSPGGGSW